MLRHARGVLRLVIVELLFRHDLDGAQGPFFQYSHLDLPPLDELFHQDLRVVGEGRCQCRPDLRPRCLTMLTPTDEPSWDGFTTTGREKPRVARSSASPLRSTRYGATVRPLAWKTVLAKILFMARALARTPEPV